MAEFESKPKLDRQSETELVISGLLDGDDFAILEILERDNLIVIEQPDSGKTIADSGVKVTVIPREE